MVYQIIYSREAEKQLKKLDKHTSERIILVIERLRIRPYIHVKKVIGTNYFRARAGKWRIFIKIENNELQILVLKIKRRENVYENI